MWMLTCVTWNICNDDAISSLIDDCLAFNMFGLELPLLLDRLDGAGETNSLGQKMLEISSGVRKTEVNE